jgi:hypothetical protein
MDIEYTWEDALELIEILNFDEKRALTRITLHKYQVIPFIESLTNLDACKLNRINDIYTKRDFIFHTAYNDVPLYINDFPDLVKWRLKIRK